jgi:hypothetical protein
MLSPADSKAVYIRLREPLCEDVRAQRSGYPAQSCGCEEVGLVRVQDSTVGKANFVIVGGARLSAG